MRRIKWLIAHEPQHLFVRTAAAFAQKIHELTGGDIMIEPLTVEEYKAKIMPDCDINGVQQLLFDALEQDRIQISQTQTHFFSRYDINFRSLDLPFLFRDHDHTTKVLEGEIGTALRVLAVDLSERSGKAGHSG